MKRTIRVRAIIVDDEGKLFCVKLKAYGGRKAQDFWILPGGEINLGESLVDALHREMLEETAVAPKIGNLLYVQQFTFEGEEQLEFLFHVSNFADYKQFDISKASHAEEEIADFGFVPTKSTYILPKFLTTEDLSKHIENPGPPKIFDYLQVSIV